MYRKRITLFVISVFFVSLVSFGQTQRMVLAEEFTSATCPPCASQNPAFNALLEANTDIVTSIKYQMNWPTAGGDPMYLDNPVDNTARRSYYGVNSIPWVALDGGFSNQPQYVTQSVLNNAAAEASPFEIQAQHYLSPNEDSIYLITLIKATEDISGNMVAHNVIVEKEINFSSPPGGTSEKDFYNVMKKMLPTANGTSLPSTMEAGDYVILQNSWELANVYDIDELAAVVFVQNPNTKEVFQAANSSTDAITPAYTVDAEVLSVLYTTTTNCSGMINPSVSIRNNGADNLTSATINYAVNGGEEMTYDWTGDLMFLESVTIELSELSFPVMDTNNLIINSINTNGTDDEYQKNNTYNFEMLRAPVLTGTSIVFLNLDDKPEETTWEILNSAGEVVQSGGPYTSSGQKFEPITVSETDCYSFIIYDAGGDGTEYYAVVYGNNQIAFEGFSFEDMAVNEFAMGTVGIETPGEFTSMKVYPNPASEKINIDFVLIETAEVTIRVMDLMGKTLSEVIPGKTNNGNQEFTIDTSGLSSGIYLVQVEIGNDVYIEKVTIR